ncbi:hypothetical protein DYB28_010828 [Aphanomyces astaci]|uniref:Uncharacterized protein n=1 Tax=Aphanomyces astaci TaxID=112090 RepID=A0A397EFT8_APHAT|nr:hypothetical protein DYB25_000343 [Aphanomyces astaci]RHY36359.1 hypothetical protein DYB34_008739 [Aphanomyces astaci]RHY75039.1 hypothetical protein DYB30_001609 [Aphanomyces astaci]RHY78473.1 hypothetical protein DYB38_000435 [Aphanomyces astaci]RHZ05725.1 hypothetical protein DYB31_001393 [Aphanomyces astaci]
MQCRTVETCRTQATLWRASGLTYFHISFQNLFAVGVVDSMVVVNAFGMAQRLTLKRTDYIARESSWSTVFMNWHPYNDLGYSQSAGYTIVRNDVGTPQFVESCPNGASLTTCPSSKFDLVLGLSATSPLVNASRRGLGPFGTVDLILVTLPPSLAAVVSAIQDLLRQCGCVFNRTSRK